MGVPEDLDPDLHRDDGPSASRFASDEDPSIVVFIEPSTHPRVIGEPACGV
jgi:hypothetical protein